VVPDLDGHDLARGTSTETLRQLEGDLFDVPECADDFAARRKYRWRIAFCSDCLVPSFQQLIRGFHPLHEASGASRLRALFEK